MGNSRPLPRSLPLRDQPFNRAACRPFFGGLLPEADQRQGAAAALGVSVANDFTLLDRLGGDVAGAIMLLPPGQDPPERSTTGAPRGRYVFRGMSEHTSAHLRYANDTLVTTSLAA